MQNATITGNSFVRCFSDMYQTDDDRGFRKFNEDLDKVIKKMRDEFMTFNNNQGKNEKILVNVKYEISIEKEKI